MGDRTRLIFAIILGLITLSVASWAELPRVNATDVLSRIEVGRPAEFDNCIIVGNLDLSALKIDEPVHFNNSRFQDSANFSSTIFNGNAYFLDSRFDIYVDFIDSAFNSDADFSGSTFNSDADFRNSTFSGYAFFTDSAFNGNAVLSDEADFSGSTFNSDADFRNSTFNSNAYFLGSEFNGDAYFGEAAFNDTADFVHSKFNVSDFIATKFNKEAQFNDAQFAGIANFDNSRFTGDALFENTIFQNTLSLTRTRYDKLFVRWYNIKGGLVYDDAAYMSLMKNFKDLGYFEDYDSCYFQYRKEHRGQPWPAVNAWEAGLRKIIDYPLEWFYGYGTKPLNAFLFSLGIIISFGGFWRALGLGGPKDRTKEGLKEGEEWLDGDITDILGFSVTVFLSGTKFFIDPPAIPKIEGHSRSLIKKAFVLERLLGALFSILFFIAVSGTIVRAT
jgi:hypothetical protein